jgi:hypothetical protein
MLRKLGSVLVLTALLGFALPLMGCPAREKSLSEKAEDAAEGVQNAAEDAGDAVKDAAEDAGDAVKESVD